MAKITTQTIPPGLLPQYLKSLRTYSLDGIDATGKPNKHRTRSGKSQALSASYIREIATAYNDLSEADKLAWIAAGAVCNRSGYRLFLADYAYRKRNGLSLPGTPSTLLQMQHLVIDNTVDTQDIVIEWHNTDTLIGVSLKFTIKYPAYTGGGDHPLTVKIRGVYPPGGPTDYDELAFTPTNDGEDWTEYELLLPASDGNYTSLLMTIEVNNWDAVVKIENIIITDTGGYVMYEYFNPARPRDWQPQLLADGVGWTFSPGYPSANLYLEYGG